MALTLVQQPGQILQVGQTVTTAIQQVVDSTPVDTALTRAITPKFSTSKVMVNIAACFTVSNVDAAETTVLLKRTIGGSTTTLINGERFVFMDGDGSGNNHVGWPSTMMYLDSPNTTSSTVYNPTFRRGSDSVTCYIGHSNMVSTFTAIEFSS